MSITDKGVVREVNRLLNDYSVRNVPSQIELGSYDMYKAEYAATALHGRVGDPVVRGLKIGLGIFNSARDFTARHAQASVRPMYKLSTQDYPKRIGTYIPVVPERIPATARTIRIASAAVASVLANHGLWLASQDAKRRSNIPDALEKRLEASSENPGGHLKIAVSAAIGEAANIAASVKTFEVDNGINNRSSNIAGYAIYGYSGGEYMRVSTIVDISDVGRF